MPLFGRGTNLKAVLQHIEQLQNFHRDRVQFVCAAGRLPAIVLPLYMSVIATPGVILKYLLSEAPLRKDIERVRVAEGEPVIGAFVTQLLACLWDLKLLVFSMYS
jgi:hypothetical protein